MGTPRRAPQTEIASKSSLEDARTGYRSEHSAVVPSAVVIDSGLSASRTNLHTTFVDEIRTESISCCSSFHRLEQPIHPADARGSSLANAHDKQETTSALNNQSRESQGAIVIPNDFGTLPLRPFGNGQSTVNTGTLEVLYYCKFAPALTLNLIISSLSSEIQNHVLMRSWSRYLC